MIIFKEAYATVWKVEDATTFVKGTISTSEKGQDGKWINSHWNVRYVGSAKEKALSLSEKDRIKIISGKITNILGGTGENKKLYTNVVIFDFEPLQSNNSSKSTQTEEEQEDALPF